MAITHRLRLVDIKRHWRLGTLLLLVVLASAWSLRERIDIALAYGHSRLIGAYSLDQRLSQFADSAQARLQPHFQAAGLAYPGERISLLAFKDRKRLELYGMHADGSWRFVRAYPVLAASGSAGPKLREGDYQVPEGRYRVTFLNPNSLYHVSLRLDYPNDFDRRMARADGRTNPGSDIMIHGKAVSVGCLAIGDEAIEELFSLAAHVGQAKVDVLIAPTDFRSQPPSATPTQPAWISQLYRSLARELQAFPPPG